MNFLIRHGESRYNAGERSNLDSDLTEKGQWQAKNAGLYLFKTIARENPNHWTIITSQYKRAIQTGEIIGRELGITKFSRDDRIGESKTVGSGYKEIDCEGDENILRRLTSFYNSVICETNNKIVISHGTPSVILKDMYSGIKHKEVPVWGRPDKIRNCEVILLR